MIVNVTNKEIEGTLQYLIHITDDSEEIMPRSDQVWNCDEIGLYSNGKWHMVVCTYKWCNIDRVWKTQ